jgi:tetratricopeptide (TPR) repeat protein
MYRHRGHRYISLRRFDDAISDLTQAASLMKGRANEIEPDGAPNERGIPLTTTGFNVWYHFGLAKYLKGDYAGALEGWDQAMMFTRGYDDNLVAVTAWGYMTLCRHGRFAQAARALDPIRPDMDIIENHAYHKILLMHKGLVSPDELLRGVDESSLDFATLGYGLGFWYLQKGDRAAATEIFERVERGPYWPAFGYIAAEVELARLYQRR